MITLQNMTPPAVEEKRSLLSRALQVRASGAARRVAGAVGSVRLYSGYDGVCDDGRCTPHLRYGNVVAEELQVPITMFLPVGNILKHDTYTASFKEIRDYNASGLGDAKSSCRQVISR